MSAAVRGSGVSSYTVTISAIRWRLVFSPLDRRVLSLPDAVCACVRVCSPSAPGAHHHPLRIARAHQQILAGQRALALRVERIDVLGASILLVILGGVARPLVAFRPRPPPGEGLECLPH